MLNTLTAYNYAGEPRFRVFPDDDRFQYTQLFDVQNHCLADRQVDTFIVKRVRFVGNQCSFSGSNANTFVLPLAPYTSFESLAIREPPRYGSWWGKLLSNRALLRGHADLCASWYIAQ